MYYLDRDNKEQGMGILLDFIQYLETKSKQQKIKLRTNKELKKAKETLKTISLKESK